MKSIILVALLIAASQLTGCSQKSNSVIAGKVSEVTMENQRVEFNFASLKGADAGHQPLVVIINLEGRDKDSFIILADRILTLDGFKDLENNSLGWPQIMGRLGGKKVELTYSEVTTNESFVGYLVTNVKFKPTAKSAQDTK